MKDKEREFGAKGREGRGTTGRGFSTQNLAGPRQRTQTSRQGFQRQKYLHIGNENLKMKKLG